MPQIIVANVDSKSMVVSWVDWRGGRATSSLRDVPAAATEAQLLAVVNAAGALSNAAIYKQSYHSESEASIEASTAYDDAISEARVGANVTFQNTVTLAVKIFRVPALHNSHVTADGQFMKDRADDAGVETLLAAMETALGASWTFTTAPITTRGESTPAVRVTPIVTEPP